MTTHPDYAIKYDEDGLRWEFVGGVWVRSVKICPFCKSSNIWEHRNCDVCGRTI